MTNNQTITPELLDQLLANYEKPEDLTGANGLFKQLKCLSWKFLNRMNHL